MLPVTQHAVERHHPSPPARRADSGRRASLGSTAGQRAYEQCWFLGAGQGREGDRVYWYFRIAGKPASMIKPLSAKRSLIMALQQDEKELLERYKEEKFAVALLSVPTTVAHHEWHDVTGA